MSFPNPIPSRNLRESPRRGASACGQGGDVRALAVQFRDFRSVAGEILRDPRLLQSTILQQAGGEIRGFSKRICRALSVAENIKTAEPVSGSWIEEMLEEGEIFLEQVQQQLTWQAQVTRQAKELRPLTDVLLKQGAGASEQLCYDSFAQIVTSILRHNPFSGWNFETYPIARISSDLLIHQGEDPLVAESTVQGILSCWSVVRLAKSLWLNEARIVPLGVAALLQDLGLLALRTAHREAAEVPHADLSNPQSQRFLQHPTIGAAIVAGLADVPPIIPQLIAQHHERLDGTGSPRGCAGHALSRESRLLAMVIRQEELRRDENCLEQITEHSPASRTPLDLLQKETSAGHFDADLIGMFSRERGGFATQTATNTFFPEPDRHYLLDPSHAGNQPHTPPVPTDMTAHQLSRNRFFTD
ncbi:MAG: HD domain-containing phosphohydrolase [Planctomycetales bacterium]